MHRFHVEIFYFCVELFFKKRIEKLLILIIIKISTNKHFFETTHKRGFQINEVEINRINRLASTLS